MDMSGGGEKEEGERIPRRLCSVSTEPMLGLELMNCQIVTWAEIKSLGLYSTLCVSCHLGQLADFPPISHIHTNIVSEKVQNVADYWQGYSPVSQVHPYWFGLAPSQFSPHWLSSRLCSDPGPSHSQYDWRPGNQQNWSTFSSGYWYVGSILHRLRPVHHLPRSRSLCIHREMITMGSLQVWWSSGGIHHISLWRNFLWGTGGPQSVKHLTSAQVMISWFHEFEPHVGLCADISEPGTCFRFCLPLSLPLLLSLFPLSLSLLKLNKH